MSCGSLFASSRLVVSVAGTLFFGFALAGAPRAQEEAPAWPFGGGRGFEGRDLWNLGLLGAKAWDADLPPPGRREGRIAVSANPDPKDEGPARLRIEMLFPGGPAAKAGLLVGDVIVGVGGKSFPDGALGPLSAALVKAEGSPKGVIVLDVERSGQKGSEKLKLPVPIPSGGADALQPTRGKGRAAILDRAAAFLAERQKDDGGFAETLSSRNGAIVQVSLAGLVWLGHGGAKYAEHVDKAVKFILRYLPEGSERRLGAAGGANWDQTNWGYVHAGLFLAEVEGRKPSALVRRELERIAAEIAKRQESSGGYAHGPGGKNALGYLELNIVSALAVHALGAANQVGIKIDLKAAEKALAYLEASGGGDGGVGYSTMPGQKGQGNIGRTAASWLGAEGLGFARHPFTGKMRNYVERNAADVLGGHASLMQHILLAGLAAARLGGAAEKEYWNRLERDLVLARAPDGSLQPRPWHESVSMGSNSDVTFGEIWTTAAWALVLAADAKETKGQGVPVVLATRGGAKK